MKEFYITQGELNDLKHALKTGNKKMMQHILHDIEFRMDRTFLFDYSARLNYLVNSGLSLEKAEEIVIREERESIQ